MSEELEHDLPICHLHEPTSSYLLHNRPDVERRLEHVDTKELQHEFDNDAKAHRNEWIKEVRHTVTDPLHGRPIVGVQEKDFEAQRGDSDRGSSQLAGNAEKDGDKQFYDFCEQVVEVRRVIAQVLGRHSRN
ncbi:hypothetical protein SeLEV6574_g03283 [Synchytrium endobioticum]|uniref:Uncharacterized protein n=1 Tax=Synchytrium endobioticum TaxID=286115 RepID=A0A507D4S4_9FUNG|nr:hypothetical protein SeLEV6574_g03283 [Synchytrium endobioticum]